MPAAFAAALAREKKLAHCYARRIEWRWLKGHAGHADNERCDQLAAAEMAKLRQSYSRPQLAALRDQFLASREMGCNQATLL